MEKSNSITAWIVNLQKGDQDALAPLWERYYARLAAVVRNKLGPLRGKIADEEDVAASAFYAFFQRIEAGRLPNLQGRDELWRVLVVIAKHKAISLIRRELAQVRGGGKVEGEPFLTDAAGHETSPEFAAELLDESRHLLDTLHQEDATLSLIALRKLEGRSNKEIAAELGVTLRTVQRKLERIGILWEADLEKRYTPNRPLALETDSKRETQARLLRTGE